VKKDKKGLQLLGRSEARVPAAPTAAILETFRPDLVHVQHFLHWPLSVIDQAVASRVMKDDSGVPVVRVKESATTVGARAPGKTIGASSGVSSVAVAFGPVTRTGAPRSSASAARIRATVAKIASA